MSARSAAKREAAPQQGHDDATARVVVDFEKLVAIGVALSIETDPDRLLELILLEAKRYCNADGATLYLREDDNLRFAIVHNDSLALRQHAGMQAGDAFISLPLYVGDSHEPNIGTVATRVALGGEAIAIDDVYHSPLFDFTGTREFDERMNYKTSSMLTLPLPAREGGAALGVLQLVNAREPGGDVVPFGEDMRPFLQALCGQAAIAIENQRLLARQKSLLQSLGEQLDKQAGLSAVEIEARAMAEERADNLSALLHAMIEAHPGAALACDGEGYLVAANDKACALCGIAPATVADQPSLAISLEGAVSSGCLVDPDSSLIGRLQTVTAAGGGPLELRTNDGALVMLELKRTPRLSLIALERLG